MKLLEKGLSTAAVVAAQSTLACCVPLGFLGALGLASLGVWAQPLRPWLLGASVVLLGVGFIQLHVKKVRVREAQCCEPGDFLDGCWGCVVDYSVSSGRCESDRALAW